MDDVDRAISDFSARLFLRYFRAGQLAGAERPTILKEADQELLRAHWAISAPVRDFLGYLLTHRHEAQSLLRFRPRVDDAVARGRIDARASTLARLRTGLPSLLVTEEPVRSFNTGPNQLVAWVVQQAMLYARRLQALQPPGSAYAALTEAVMGELAQVARLDALREPLKHVSGHQRPGAGAIRDATRSRLRLYREAVAAYRVLLDLEAGDEAAIRRVLESTLMAPVENWRRFELAVALAIGMTLAELLDAPLELLLLGSRPGEPLLRCGRFDLYWQQLTSLHTHAALEPSEARWAAILAAYGMSLSAERPDLVLVDVEQGRVASVIEVKYLAGDTANARFREAADQLVRYSRGYRDEAGISGLLRQSLIVLSAGAPPMVDETAAAPRSTDFAAIQQGALSCWAQERLLSAA